MLLSKNNSIKRQLFLYLSSLITLVIIIIALTSFFNTKREIQELFDANMVKSAKLLASFAKYNPKKNFEDFYAELENIFDQNDLHKYERKIHYQIWAGENLIFNSNENILLPRPVNQGFQDVLIEGESWRSFAFYQNDISIIALEEYEIRHELIAKILFYLFLTFLVSMPAIIAIIWLVIDKKLNPIKILAQKISNMSTQKLQTFDDLQVPLEIKPFVDSLNSLLSRLAQSLESERRFTDYAAHELRTPIAVIKTQSQLLLRNKNKEKEEEYLHDLIAAVDRCDHLINQILVLARLEPEDKNIAKEKIDLTNLVENLVLQYQKNTDHKIIINAQGTLYMAANRIYFEIMFGNLLDNAIKYSEKNSEIKIDLENKESTIIIRITNKGAPLSMQEQEKIFEKFYRIHGTNQIGCGLGLAIAKKITELSGGQISFVSKDGENSVEVVL